jgi:DNA-binding beta-propeller fold protein YncE
VSAISTGSLSVASLTYDCTGAYGLAFDRAGNIFVANQRTGEVFRFGPSGGPAPKTSNFGPGVGAGATDLTFGSGGELFGLQPQTNGNYGAGAVIQLDPATGQVARTVTSALRTPTWIASDPVTGEVYVTNGGTGTLFGNQIWRIENPAGRTGASPVSTFTAGASGFAQLTFAPNGTLYALTRDGRVLGMATPAGEPNQTELVKVPVNSTGLALGPLDAAGKPTAVYVSQGATISRVQVSNGAVTPVVTGGYNLIDLKVSGDHCLYATNVSTVLKIAHADGSCDWTPAPGAS